eukprot:scaffold10310_cov109-Isochrysis_galbana.AAC.4
MPSFRTHKQPRRSSAPCPRPGHRPAPAGPCLSRVLLSSATRRLKQLTHAYKLLAHLSRRRPPPRLGLRHPARRLKPHHLPAMGVEDLADLRVASPAACARPAVRLFLGRPISVVLQQRGHRLGGVAHVGEDHPARPPLEPPGHIQACGRAGLEVGGV